MTVMDSKLAGPMMASYFSRSWLAEGGTSAAVAAATRTGRAMRASGMDLLSHGAQGLDRPQTGGLPGRVKRGQDRAGNRRRHRQGGDAGRNDGDQVVTGHV